MKKLIVGAILSAISLQALGQPSQPSYEVGRLYEPISWPGLSWRPFGYEFRGPGIWTPVAGAWIESPIGFLTRPAGPSWRLRWIETRWCPSRTGWLWQPGGWYWCSADK